MLETLKGYSPTEIQSTLADVSTVFLPIAPDDETDLKRIKSSELVSSVLDEVRRKLGLSSDDFSPKAKNRIQRLLLGELTKSVLFDSDEKEIKTRLGQSGRLNPRAYLIEFSDMFRSNQYGVTKIQAQNAIKNADYYQHLHPEGVDSNPENSVSLFTKITIGKKIEDNNTLLVVTQRKGFTQLVNEAWIVYHNEVDITEAQTPLDILKLFVTKYGEEIKIGGKKGTFFWMETVPIKPGENPILIKKEAFKKDRRFIISMQGANFPDRIEIAHCYGINLDLYIPDLNKHGHNIKRSKPTPNIRIVKS